MLLFKPLPLVHKDPIEIPPFKDTVSLVCRSLFEKHFFVPSCFAISLWTTLLLRHLRNSKEYEVEFFDLLI